MATHSSIFAWETPEQRSMEGYSPWGYKRIRHDLATKQQEVREIFHIDQSQCFNIIGAVASLLQSVGSRRTGFSSCDSQALEHRLSSCGARAELLLHMWGLPGAGVGPCALCWQVDSYPLHHHGVP